MTAREDAVEAVRHLAAQAAATMELVHDLADAVTSVHRPAHQNSGTTVEVHLEMSPELLLRVEQTIGRELTTS